MTGYCIKFVTDIIWKGIFSNMGHKYKKTEVKDVKIERINLKNKAYFLRKAYKNGGCNEKGYGKCDKRQQKRNI